MSFDLAVVEHRPGESWEEAWEAHAQGRPVDLPARWWEPVVATLLERFPSWESFPLEGTAEINDPVRGIQVIMSDAGAFVSIAYWDLPPEEGDPLELALEAVKLIEAATGLHGFDPQSMVPTGDTTGPAKAVRSDARDWIEGRSLATGSGATPPQGQPPARRRGLWRR